MASLTKQKLIYTARQRFGTHVEIEALWIFIIIIIIIIITNIIIIVFNKAQAGL